MIEFTDLVCIEQFSRNCIFMWKHVFVHLPISRLFWQFHQRRFYSIHLSSCKISLKLAQSVEGYQKCSKNKQSVLTTHRMHPNSVPHETISWNYCKNGQNACFRKNDFSIKVRFTFKLWISSHLTFIPLRITEKLES